jgi:hypothetical protein
MKGSSKNFGRGLKWKPGGLLAKPFDTSAAVHQRMESGEGSMSPYLTAEV